MLENSAEKKRCYHLSETRVTCLVLYDQIFSLISEKLQIFTIEELKPEHFCGIFALKKKKTNDYSIIKIAAS